MVTSTHLVKMQKNTERPMGLAKSAPRIGGWNSNINRSRSGLEHDLKYGFVSFMALFSPTTKR